MPTPTETNPVVLMTGLTVEISPCASSNRPGRNPTEDEWAEFGPRTIERRRIYPEFPL